METRGRNDVANHIDVNQIQKVLAKLIYAGESADITCKISKDEKNIHIYIDDEYFNSVVNTYAKLVKLVLDTTEKAYIRGVQDTLGKVIKDIKAIK